MDKIFPLADQIEMLGTALKGRVIGTAHPDYEALRSVVNGKYDRRPAAIIRPANAADVAAAINFAQATDLELAIRSGGHSITGASGSDGGLVLDLRELNGIDIDAEARTAWVGAGLSCGEITRAVEAQGLIVGFGDSPSVGVGGLTLGGGIGYLVRKHGLTIDSLLAVEIVTAAGDILIADETHHPDLFWALRGGGGNFGVATRFRFRLHPLPAFTGGALALPATPEVLAGFAVAAEAAPEELSSIVLVMPAPPLPVLPAEVHGKLIVVALMAFAGEPAAAQAALAPFRALATPLADLVQPAPYSSLYELAPPEVGRPAVTMRSRLVDGLSLEQAHEMIAALERCTAPMKMAQLRVLGGAASRVPVGATAFAHRQSRMLVAFLSMYGGSPDLVAEQEAWADAAMASFHGHETGAYVNFLGPEGASGLGIAYPPATLARLREVKRRYDPENLFHLNQNIVP